MKMNTKFLLLVSLMVSTILWVSCDGGKEPDPVVEFAEPTIEITNPDVSQSIAAVEGESIAFDFTLTAEAGLSSLKLNGTNIEAFDGVVTSATVNYEYTATVEGEVTLEFTVEDVESQTASVSVTLNVEKGQYLILDFGGSSSTSSVKNFRTWDTRTVYTFGVTGSVTNSATVEAIASQAAISFGVTDPAGGVENVFKIVKTPDLTIEGNTNWGGWAHLVVDLGATLSTEEVDALPHWDNDNSAQIDGTKILQVDAYYDDTVDPDFNWNDLLNVDTEPWGSDPTLGYKIQLTLGKYGEPAENGLLGYGGHNGQGYHITYIDYIDKPNEWVTLTFYVDALQAANFYPTSENAVSSSEIDALLITPAGGYEAEDSNPLYLRNLRIVDAE